MDARRPIVIALAAFAVTFAPAGYAWAQPKPKASAEPASAKDQARVLFEKGTTALGDKDFKTAAQLLSEAEGLFHAPTTLFYLGTAQMELGLLLEAQASFKRVAEEKLSPKASDAFKKAQSESKKALIDLDARIPSVLVTVEPAGSQGVTVTMNGKPLEGVVLGEKSRINPGSYQFEAKAEGLISAKLTVAAAERTTADVRLVLQPVGKPQVEQAVIVQPVGDEWPAGRVASIPIMITGGALAVAGGVLFGLSAMKRSEADDRYDQCPTCEAEVTSLDDQATLFGNLGIGFAAVGGAAVLSGALMFALLGESGAEAPAAGDVSFLLGVPQANVGASLRIQLQ
jgi:hypothetical protein